MCFVERVGFIVGPEYLIPNVGGITSKPTAETE